MIDISQMVDTSKVHWEYDDCNGMCDFWETEFLGFSLSIEGLLDCTFWTIQKGEEEDDESVLIKGETKETDPEKVQSMLLEKVLALKVIL